MEDKAMLKFRRVDYRKGLYSVYIWQPIFGLGFQLETGCGVSTSGNHVRVWVCRVQKMSCRVYLHHATNVCSYAYPSSTARSLFYVNNTLITMTFISFFLVALVLYII